jgi:hypothetical protein
MACDADTLTSALEFEHLRFLRRRRQTERNTNNQAMTPAVKMLNWRLADR